MKYLSYFFLFSLLFSVVSCDPDDEHMDDDDNPMPVYSITIMSPDATNKEVGDEIHIHVNFDEASDGTIHHVNVSIVEKGNESNVLYSAPAEAHVHEASGHFEHHADVTLSGDAIMNSNGNVWILRAKVWGHEAGAAEVTEEIEFELAHPAVPPSYSITIMSPDATDKMIGDDIHIHVNFDEAEMGTIHHVNVQIFEKDNETNVLYNGPVEAHVHDETGHFELHDDVTLEGAGVTADSDWVLQAKVWGHAAGMAEVIETREFHIQ